VLDFSCSTVSWHRIYYGKDSRDKDTNNSARGNTQNIADVSKSGANCRPPGAALFSLDEGFIRTSYIKAVEAVDSYDLDIEAIYRRHSAEEMSLPVFCFRINFGCALNDNEFLYFLAPQQIANNWMFELQRVVECVREQGRNPVIWLKKLYLQLYNECEKDSRYSEYKRLGPRPVEALQMFGGTINNTFYIGSKLFMIFRTS
jgi:hypothetical protein